MVTVLPWSSVTVIVLFSESTLMVEILPDFLSRTTMVPVESSFDTVSRSGFAATVILATARAGFFWINSGSMPACFALCITKKPSPATTTMQRIIKTPHPPRTQRSVLDLLAATTGWAAAAGMGGVVGAVGGAGGGVVDMGRLLNSFGNLGVSSRHYTYIVTPRQGFLSSGYGITDTWPGPLLGCSELVPSTIR